MIVYLVTADTYEYKDESYGSYIDCFGVAESAYELEIIKAAVIAKGYQPKVTELETGVLVQVELGGYAE